MQYFDKEPFVLIKTYSPTQERGKTGLREKNQIETDRVKEMKEGIGIRSVDANAKLFPIAFSLSQLIFWILVFISCILINLYLYIHYIL